MQGHAAMWDSGAGNGPWHAVNDGRLFALRDDGPPCGGDGFCAFDSVVTHARENDGNGTRACGCGDAAEQAITARYIAVGRLRWNQADPVLTVRRKLDLHALTTRANECRLSRY